MDPIHIKKIEDLVIQSKILSPQERAEWLALLDLMNDKQMGELEEILGNAKFQIPNSKMAAVNKTNTIDRTDTTNRTNGADGGAKTSRTLAATPAGMLQKMEAQPHMPNLSHIINLPRIQKSANQPISLSANQRPAAISGSANRNDRIYRLSAADKTMGQAAAAPRPGGKFARQLQAELAEKELPAAPAELELPEGRRPASQPVSQSANQPIRRTTADETNAPVHAGLPPLPPVPRPGESANRRSANQQIGGQQISKSANQHSGGLRPSTESQRLADKILAEKPSPAPMPAKGLSKLPDKILSKAEPLLKQADAVPVGAAELKPAASPPAPPADKSRAVSNEPAPASAKSGRRLSGLEDLPTINDGDLAAGYQPLAGQIANLVGRFGYHEVLTNLEQSPLYRHYLQTGTAALKGRVSFERLADSQSGMLDRARFEQMADLLRAIQTG